MRRATQCLATLFLISASHFAFAQCKVARQTTVPLTLDHNRAIVPMAINETPGQFEVDTGSSVTVLSKDYARISHVGIDGHAGQYVMTGAGNKESLPAFNVHARHIQFGDIPFYDWEFAATDGDIPSPIAVSGLLGRDFMHYFDIEMDFQAGKLTVWRLFNCKDVHPFWTGDYDTIPMKKLHDNELTVPIWIDNTFLDVMFDTGAGGLMLTHDAANRAGATDAQLAHDTQTNGLGLGGQFTAAHHKFGTLLVGSAIFNAPNIRVDPTNTSASGIHAYGGADGLMGLGLLHADRIWVSFTTGTLFVQAAPKTAAK